MTTKEKVLAEIARAGEVPTTTLKLACACGVSFSGATAAVQELVARGDVEIVSRQPGQRGGTTYRVTVR